MADSLDKITQREHERINADEVLPADTAQSSIDDVVLPEIDDYSSNLEKELEKSSSPFKIGLNLALYSPLLLTSLTLFGPTVLLSTFIPAIGYAVGSVLENRKRGKKTTWKRMRRELYTGNIVGHADYAIFSAPEILLAAFPGFFGAGTLLSMLVKTAIFNPLLVAPYNFVYQSFTYLRDNVGWGNVFKGLFTGRIFSYMKATYHNKIKKDLWPDTKSVFKIAFPLHFFQLNYLPNATVRMVQSLLINNPIYRIIMGRKKKEPKKKKHEYKPFEYPGYQPTYQPAYARAR